MVWRSAAHGLRFPNHVIRLQPGLKGPRQGLRLYQVRARHTSNPPNWPVQSSTRPAHHTQGSKSSKKTHPSNGTYGNLPTSLIPYSTSTLPQTSPLDANKTRFPTYAIPSTGILAILPRPWVPYAELMRLDKPAGTYYLFLPCLFSTLLAATYTHPPFLSLLHTTALFFAGALIMRGAGCTINDLWDRDLDPHVRRTRLRPIARGAVSPFNALAFTGVQLFAGLGILLQFPPACFFYAVPSLILVSLYPLAKRVTHYPQVVLGLTFSWGAIMGFPALGIDLLADAAARAAAAALYASCVAWTVLYDMIYAHMDVKDDRKVGIKSMVVRHEKDTKVLMGGLAVVQIGLLAAAGAMVGAGPVFFVGSCGGGGAALAWMVWKVRLEEAGDCWWWFRRGAWLTGGGVVSGLLGEYLVDWQAGVKGTGGEEVVAGQEVVQEE